MSISSKHSNKMSHNWLNYYQGDQFLKKASFYIKGDLYDLGCGEMPYKEYFLKFADTYTGVDWNGSLHHIKNETIISDLNEKIELPDKCADTIISLSVLEHLHNPNTFFKESNRILKKDSYFILQVPFQYQIHEHPIDYFRFTKFGLKYLFEENGFEVVELEETGGFWSTIAYKFNNHTLRYLRKTKHIPILKSIIKILLVPLWTLTQVLAFLFDRIDFNSDEATGYFVVGRKI